MWMLWGSWGWGRSQMLSKRGVKKRKQGDQKTNEKDTYGGWKEVVNNMKWHYKRKIWSTLSSQSRRGIQFWIIALDLNKYFIQELIQLYYDALREAHTESAVAPNTNACKQLCVFYFCSWFTESVSTSSAFEIFSGGVYKGRCTVLQLKRSAGHNKIWSICGIACPLCPYRIEPLDWHMCWWLRFYMFVRLSMKNACTYTSLHLLKWLVTS